MTVGFHPVAMNWVITNQCPLRCVHCLNGFHRPDPSELSTSDRMRLIEVVALLGVRRLSVMGGEPFVVRDLDLLVEYARRHDIDVNITTSGIVADRAMLQRMKAGVEYLNVSIDGSRALNDRFRGAGVWDKATAFCRLARDCDIPLRLYTVLSCANARPQETAEIVRLCREFHVQTLMLINFSPIGEGEGMQSLRLSCEERDAMLRTYRDRLAADGIQVKKADPYEPESQKVFIDPQGGLYVPQGRFPRRAAGRLVPEPRLDFSTALRESHAIQHMDEYADREQRPKRNLMRKLCPPGSTWIPATLDTSGFKPGFYIDSAAFAPAHARRLPTRHELERARHLTAANAFPSDHPYTVMDGAEWVRREVSGEAPPGGC